MTALSARPESTLQPGILVPDQQRMSNPSWKDDFLSSLHTKISTVYGRNEKLE
jgi:hypothetical protein